MEFKKRTIEELKESIRELMKREYESDDYHNEHSFFLRIVFARVAGRLNKYNIPFSKVYIIINEIYEEEYLNK